MEENKLSFSKFSFNKWYFWVIIVLHSIISQNFYIGLLLPEIIGSLAACFLIWTFLFGIVYGIIKLIRIAKGKKK